MTLNVLVRQDILTRLDHIELAPGFVYGESLIGTAAREIGHRLREGVNLRRPPARSWLSLTDTERTVAHGVGGADRDGSGLTGLRERAEALGGTLKLTSPPGRGTSVDVRLPAAPR